MKAATYAVTIALSAVLASPLSALAQQPMPKPVQLPPSGTKIAQKITVNGKVIPNSRFDFFYRQRLAQGTQAQGPSPDSPEFAKAVKEELINREILSQEAERLGLDKSADVLSQLDMARQQVLVGAILGDYMKKNPIKDETLKAEYERIKTNMGDKEYKVSHILLAKEEEAKDILAQLKKGSDFEKIAKEKSTDSGSKGDGGKLDWAAKAAFPPTFAEALTKLQKGQTTQAAVKTPAGFHIIRLDDTRPAKVPGFDEVKDNLRRGASQQAVAKMVNDLRKNAKIDEQ